MDDGNHEMPETEVDISLFLTWCRELPRSLTLSLIILTACIFAESQNGAGVPAQSFQYQFVRGKKDARYVL